MTYISIVVYFDDNTHTILTILEEDNIQDKIVNLCEVENWDIESVTNWKLLNP